MTDGTRAWELRSIIYTWCDGCHFDKKKQCGSPLLRVSCPISIALEAIKLYDQEKKARQEAEQREWSRSPRNDR